MFILCNFMCCHIFDVCLDCVHTRTLLSLIISKYIICCCLLRLHQRHMTDNLSRTIFCCCLLSYKKPVWPTKDLRVNIVAVLVVTLNTIPFLNYLLIHKNIFPFISFYCFVTFQLPFCNLNWISFKFVFVNK